MATWTRHKVPGNPIVGTCPSCREEVRANEPDGPVWTCPANLAKTNPYWEPPLAEISIRLQNRVGLWSYCLDDWDKSDLGLPHVRECYEMMPLHSKCYERGNY